MKYILLIFLIFIYTCSFSQNDKKHTVSGYVKEAGSGELLIGASVYTPKYQTGNFANNYGFYSITLPATDSLELVFSLFGYLTQTKIVNLNKNIELNIFLTGDTVVLEEVVIEVDPFKGVSDGAQLSTVEIPVKQIKDVPSLLGEKDVFKVLQLMPGVKKGTEGSSGLYVRGGGPDQNLIILDDATVYNASHLFGFFSLFNGDALKSVELSKGGFSARYGGRLSSVLEMNMKEGNKEKLHGEAGMGLISSRLTLEGPIKKDKSSFLISGRRTYIDLLISPFLSSSQKGGYNFHDLNAKVNYDFGQKNKLYLSGYFGRDKFYQRSKYESTTFYSDSKTDLGWSNATGTIRWNHLFSNKIFANTSLIFSNYIFRIKSDYVSQGDEFYLRYSSGIRDLSLKCDIDFLPSTRHTFRFGLISTFHTFTPGAIVLKDTYYNEAKIFTQKIHAFESGLYAEDIYKPSPRLTINTGIRFSGFTTGNKNYFNPEPRFSAGYKLKEDLAVKAGYSLMNQYLHLLSNTGIGLPTDLWVPATDNVEPQNSHQVVAGVAKDFSKHKTSLTIEGYYKKINKTVGYKEGADFLIVDDPSTSEIKNWEENVVSGQAWAYGIEFLLQKKNGKFSGWIGYTLSWIQVQFDSINQGEKYYAKYDRRHDFSVVAIYKPKEKITFSLSWVYGTGNAITLPVSSFSAPNHQPGHYRYNVLFNEFTEYGKRNSSRMPAYHRLDAGVQFHKDLKWGRKRTWEISVYNLYNRQNPFFYFIDFDYINNKNILKQVSLFPVIPSISYHIKF